MIESPFFSDEEYGSRLRNLRKTMAGRNLDVCLICVPENIYYLVGLSHQGFFACHMLLVPADGELVLITRAMEQAVVRDQVSRATHVGYADHEDPAAVACKVLRDRGFVAGCIGIEKNSLFLTPRIAEGIASQLSHSQISDVSGIVDEQRMIKSPREISYTRQAAEVADAMMEVAIETADEGVSEKEVAAEVHRTMILAGGEYPGFGPFIRSTPTLPWEHGVWSDHTLRRGEMLFLEMAGCVARYHAPIGRLVFIGDAPSGTSEVERVSIEAMDAVVAAIKPGAIMGDVYQVWQDRVDAAGLSHYRRHHCGYSVGIGFPPSWTGGGHVVGIRAGSTMPIRAGMVFHLLSWLLGCGRGDYFVSDAAFVTEEGCEVLCTASRQLDIL